MLKLEEAEQREEDRLKQYFVNCPEEDKLLIVVVLLRLKVVSKTNKIQVLLFCFF